VVLGGGLDVRPIAAAELYQKGLVKTVLVSQVGDSPTVALGAQRGHTEANRYILLKLGVPPDAIETFGHASKNTKDEARALLEWVHEHSTQAVIIPVEIFEARRVRWIFRRTFADQPTRIEVPSLDPPEYTRANWWTEARGILEFQNEVLKFIYYRLKY
jgi:hypothetical protein